MMTMVMKTHTYTATRLKARLLGVLDDVAETGEPVTVTKHGKPVARIVPIENAPSLLGSVKILVSDEELIKPIDIHWNADSS
jgi:prevent-host-death family protein